MSLSPTPVPAPGQADLVSLKLTHAGLTRRLSIAAHPAPTWAALAAEIQARFGLADEAMDNLGLSYVDEDGDAILLSSDLELAELWSALVSEDTFAQPKFTVVDLADKDHNNTRDSDQTINNDAHLTDLLSQVRLAVEADPTVAMHLRGVVHEAFATQHPSHPAFGRGPRPHHQPQGHPHHFGPHPHPRGPHHADAKAAHQQARESRHLARAARRLARENRRNARNTSDSSPSSGSEDSSTSDSSSESEGERCKGKGKGRKSHYGRHHELFGPEAGAFGLGGGRGFGGAGPGGGHAHGKHKHFSGPHHPHHFGGPGGPPPPSGGSGGFGRGPGGPHPAFGFGPEPGMSPSGPAHHHPHHFGGPGGGRGGRGGFGHFGGGRGGFGGGPGVGRHHPFGFNHGPEAGPSGFPRMPGPPPASTGDHDIDFELDGYAVPFAFDQGEGPNERRHREHRKDKGGRHGKHDRVHGGRKDHGERGEKGERA